MPAASRPREVLARGRVDEAVGLVGCWAHLIQDGHGLGGKGDLTTTEGS